MSDLAAVSPFVSPNGFQILLGVQNSGVSRHYFFDTILLELEKG